MSAFKKMSSVWSLCVCRAVHLHQSMHLHTFFSSLKACASKVRYHLKSCKTFVNKNDMTKVFWPPPGNSLVDTHVKSCVFQIAQHTTQLHENYREHYIKNSLLILEIWILERLNRNTKIPNLNTTILVHLLDLLFITIPVFCFTIVHTKMTYSLTMQVFILRVKASTPYALFGCSLVFPCFHVLLNVYYSRINIFLVFYSNSSTYKNMTAWKH
jgi:hypothetical protein